MIGVDQTIGYAPGLPESGQSLVVAMVSQGGEHRSNSLVHRLYIDADLDKVSDVLVEVQHRATDLVGDLLWRHAHHFVGIGLGWRRDPTGRDGHTQVDVDPLGRDPVRVEVDVVGASSEFLDAHGVLGPAIRLPAEHPELPARQKVLLGVLPGGWHLERQDRRDAQVGEETEEGLRPLRLVDARHAEELEGGKRVDDQALVVPAADLLSQSGLEGRHRHLDALELRGLADRERNLSEAYGFAHRRDVLERDPLVPHHVRNGIENEDLVELGPHRAMVQPNLVGGIFQGDVEDLLAPADPLDEELESEGRLSGSRGTDEQVGPVGEQTP